jgi:hypothetical protein
MFSIVGGSTLTAHSQHIQRGRILGRNLDKSFPPCYSQSPLQLCLEISISSYSHNLLQFLQFSAKEKEGKPDRKPYPLPSGLRNPIRNLKSENSQDYARKPYRNCTFMNSASGQNWFGKAGMWECEYFAILIWSPAFLKRGDCGVGKGCRQWVLWVLCP